MIKITLFIWVVPFLTVPCHGAEVPYQVPDEARMKLHLIFRHQSSSDLIAMLEKDPKLVNAEYGSTLLLNYAIEQSGSPTFLVGDSVDLPSLAKKLKQQNSRAFDTWFLKQLSEKTQRLLENYQGQDADGLALRRALVQDLNKLIKSVSIYDQERFREIKLRRETWDSVWRTPRGTVSTHFNRLLIEDAYPQEVSRMEGREPKMARVLLDHGANVNAHDKYFMYPVHVAAGCRNPDLVKELVSRGAQLNVTNDIGRLPIHQATLGFNAANILWLLERGNAVDAVDERNQTPLFLAAMNGMDDRVNLLLDKGADINHRDKDGLTPLHWAVFRAATNTVGILIRRGAEVSVRSKRGIRSYFGLTALGVAKKEGDKEMVEFLRKAGVKK